MNELKLQKKINKLLNKNAGRCSICKTAYDEEVLTYTCTGLDKIKRLQTTSSCCKDRIVKVISIGVAGFFDSENSEEIMSNHPLYHEFYCSQER